MKCQLCLGERDLKESHIIPKFVGKWLKDTSATGYIRQAKQPNLRQQDFHTERLLCGECENLFSQWENLFTKNIFLPYVNEGKRTFDYENWLLKFAVSLIWRVGLVELNDFREFKPDLANHLEYALSVWRKLLIDPVLPQETFGFHLLFLDIVKGVDGMDLPEGLHWYNLRAVDASIFANKSEVYAYAKLPSMIFFAGIFPRRPSKWKNTRLHERGKIMASNQEVSHSVFVEFYLNRAKQGRALWENMSPKQQEKIEKSISSDPERSINSDSFQVYLAEQYWEKRQKRATDE